MFIATKGNKTFSEIFNWFWLYDWIFIFEYRHIHRMFSSIFITVVLRQYGQYNKNKIINDINKYLQFLFFFLVRHIGTHGLWVYKLYGLRSVYIVYWFGCTIMVTIIIVHIWFTSCVLNSSMCKRWPPQM